MMADDPVQTLETITEQMAVVLHCDPVALRRDIEERMQDARHLERVARIAGKLRHIETRDHSEVAAFFVAAAGAALADPAVALAIGRRMRPEAP